MPNKTKKTSDRAGSGALPPGVAEALRDMNWDARLEDARKRRAAVLAERASDSPQEPLLDMPVPVSVQPEELISEHPATPRWPLLNGVTTVVLALGIWVVLLGGGELLTPKTAFALLSPVAPAEDELQNALPPDLGETIVSTTAAAVSQKLFHGLSGDEMALSAFETELPVVPGTQSVAAPTQRQIAALLIPAAGPPKSDFHLVEQDASIVVAALEDPVDPSRLRPMAAPGRRSGLPTVTKRSNMPGRLGGSDVRVGEDPGLQSDLYLVVFAPSGVAQEQVDAALQEVQGSGHAVADADFVNFTVKAAHVRFYHKADRDAAKGIADAAGADLRDFTNYAPEPPAGTVELWLSGEPDPASVAVARRRATLPLMLSDLNNQFRAATRRGLPALLQGPSRKAKSTTGTRRAGSSDRSMDFLRGAPSVNGRSSKPGKGKGKAKGKNN